MLTLILLQIGQYFDPYLQQSYSNSMSRTCTPLFPFVVGACQEVVGTHGTLITLCGRNLTIIRQLADLWSARQERSVREILEAQREQLRDTYRTLRTTPLSCDGYGANCLGFFGCEVPAPGDRRHAESATGLRHCPARRVRAGRACGHADRLARQVALTGENKRPRHLNRWGRRVARVDDFDAALFSGLNVDCL
jgi:hypothetical protein